MTSHGSKPVNKLLLKKAADLDMPLRESCTLRWRLRKLRRKLAPYEILPQGSLVMGTAVPATYTKDCYDLDVLIVLGNDRLLTDPRLVRKRLEASIRDVRLAGVLTNLSEGTRCWRITHRLRNLQLDLTPAVEDDSHGILITHKTEQGWTRSNPTGMAEWFYRSMCIDWRAWPIAWLASRQLREKALPFWPYKSRLQCLIKVLKVHRNVYFSKLKHDSDHRYRPSSIIVTVLAANAYQGSRHSFIESLKVTAKTMRRTLETQDSRSVFIPSPVDVSSNLAERWANDPRWRGHCCRWLRRLEADMEHLSHMDVPEARKLIADILTERPPRITTSTAADQPPKPPTKAAERETGAATEAGARGADKGRPVQRPTAEPSRQLVRRSPRTQPQPSTKPPAPKQPPARSASPKPLPRKLRRPPTAPEKNPTRAATPPSSRPPTTKETRTTQPAPQLPPPEPPPSLPAPTNPRRPRPSPPPAVKETPTPEPSKIKLRPMAELSPPTIPLRIEPSSPEPPPAPRTTTPEPPSPSPANPPSRGLPPTTAEVAPSETPELDPAEPIVVDCVAPHFSDVDSTGLETTQLDPINLIDLNTTENTVPVNWWDLMPHDWEKAVGTARLDLMVSELEPDLLDPADPDTTGLHDLDTAESDLLDPIDPDLYPAEPRSEGPHFERLDPTDLDPPVAWPSSAEPPRTASWSAEGWLSSSTGPTCSEELVRESPGFSLGL